MLLSKIIQLLTVIKELLLDDIAKYIDYDALIGSSQVHSIVTAV